MGGSDCELLRDGWLAQPANARTSLAYVVAAIVVLARCRRRAAATQLAPGALALTSVGVGSFAFHGPQPGWADAVHGGGIAALLAVCVVHLLDRPPVVAFAAGSLAAAFVVAVPSSAVGVHGLLAVALALVGLLRRRRVPGPAVIALAIALTLFALGRTDGPLCSPDSLVQPHAGWHVLTALAAAVTFMRRPPTSDPQRRRA